jgi:hypothetical protein
MAPGRIVQEEARQFYHTNPPLIEHQPAEEMIMAAPVEIEPASIADATAGMMDQRWPVSSAAHDMFSSLRPLRGSRFNGGLDMPNPHPVGAGNIGWRNAMMKSAFKKGRTNRLRCTATKRDGTPCGMLAMTSHRLMVCSAHGGAAAVARMRARKAMRRCDPK